VRLRPSLAGAASRSKYSFGPTHGMRPNTRPFSLAFLTTTGFGPDAVTDDRPRTLTGTLTAAPKPFTNRPFTP